MPLATLQALSPQPLDLEAYFGLDTLHGKEEMMNHESYEKMITAIRMNTMDKLMALIDDAREAAFDGNVRRTRRITNEALETIEMASTALIKLICAAHDADESKFNRFKNAEGERAKNEALKLKIKHEFHKHIVLAIQIQAAKSSEIGEA